MDKEIFGKFIADMRREKNMTQQTLAERLHVTNTAVSKWERGLSYPDLSLFENLAQALDLTVSELMVCRRSDRHEPSEANTESHLRSVLDVLKDTTRRHRRRTLQLGCLFLVMIVLASATIYYFSVLSVREVCYTELIGKQTDEDGRYVYVEKGTHLLRLDCPDPALYESLSADGKQLYGLEYRYNRKTCRGTLDACQALEADGFLGTPVNEVGSAWMMDNSLLGFHDVIQTVEYVMEDPIREGKYLYTFRFHYQKIADASALGAGTLMTDILSVENCRAALSCDYDGDGIWELFVLTRYKEAPYRLYDLEEGKLVSRFVEDIPEDVLQSLKSMAHDDL